MATLTELFDHWRYDSTIEQFLGPERRKLPRPEGLAFREDENDAQRCAAQNIANAEQANGRPEDA